MILNFKSKSNVNISESILLTSTTAAMNKMISRTMKFKWNWRKRKLNPCQLNNNNKHISYKCYKNSIKKTISSYLNIFNNNNNKYIFQIYLLILLFLSINLFCINGLPIKSFVVVTRSETSQTECDWSGRGGSSSSSTNMPTMTIPTSHHYYNFGDTDDTNNSNFRNSSRNATKSPTFDGHLHNDDDDSNNSLVGSSSNTLVQTISLRCSSGQIHWDEPNGGLKISIQPNIKKPYKLCLENSSSMKSVRILLEQPSSSKNDHKHKQESLYEDEESSNSQNYNNFNKLLPILTNSKSKCYQIYGSSNENDNENEPTTIYIETTTTSIINNLESTTNDKNSQSSSSSSISSSSAEDEFLISQNNLLEDDEFLPESQQQQYDGQGRNTISLSYEIESFRGDGDPCRPCSEMEVLKTYCTADAVAKGSIVQISPAEAATASTINPYNNHMNSNSIYPDEETYDSIYVKSSYVIHQTQPIFTHFNSLSSFISNSQPSSSSSSSTHHQHKKFNTNQPQRTTSLKGDFYGGIIHHPSKCSPSIGTDEEFLWLIKFRFGKPITDCVLYWDSWIQLLKNNQADCPVSF